MKRADAPERASTLLLLAMPLVAWAAHFGLTYLVASVDCAKPGLLASASLGAGTIVVVATAAALALIGVMGWSGYRRHAHGGAPPPHDADTSEDRDRFLGRASMMLAGLSAVATIYVALAVWMVPSCAPA